MKGIEHEPGGQDLHAAGDIRSPLTEFDAAEVERLMMGFGEREMSWFNDDTSNIFCDFPPLPPDFPCMSSSTSCSSSSSTPLPVKAFSCSPSSASTVSSSSSSAASWAVLKSDIVDDYNHHRNQIQNQLDVMEGLTPAAALSSTDDSIEIPDHQLPQSPDHHHHVIMEGVDCSMDVMENFGYMDLFDNNDFFDPTSIFHHDDDTAGLEEYFKQQEQKRPQQEQQQTTSSSSLQQAPTEGNKASDDDDLAVVFLEWLKTNKETISADDLRKVKIKKATIESAAKRLGGGKEAMKQLLTLILQWVQTNHLHKRRNNNHDDNNNNNDLSYREPFQNPNPNPNHNSFPLSEPNSCWNIPQPPPYVSDPGFQPVVGYMTDPFANGTPNYRQTQFGLAHPQYNSFPVLPENNLNQLPPHAFPGTYPYQYVHGHAHNDEQRLGSSATKEARKKRMARQRRIGTHHRNHQHQNQSVDHQHARLVNDNCVAAVAAATQFVNPGNWIYWPPIVSNPPSVVLPGTEVAFAHHVDRTAMQGQTYQRQVAPDHRRQVWKTEKNLRFLLQKVLKQSDVSNLGRIVLPKKEAETHLPGLNARDGISIAMEDIGTSRVWNMRYRFWPNNKSRMYLLENTGDFVRTNELQEGDFIVIYSDVKCGKYLIRGVKVRQSGAKPETKRPGKSQKNKHANSPASAINGKQ